MITLITVLTFTDLMLKPVLVAAASLIEGYPFHSFVCLCQSCREEYHAAALRYFCPGRAIIDLRHTASCTDHIEMVKSIVNSAQIYKVQVNKKFRKFEVYIGIA